MSYFVFQSVRKSDKYSFTHIKKKRLSIKWILKMWCFKQLIKEVDPLRALQDFILLSYIVILQERI